MRSGREVSSFLFFHLHVHPEVYTTLRQLHHTPKDSWSSQQRRLSGAQVGLLSVKYNSSLSLLLTTFGILVRYGGVARPMGRSLWEVVAAAVEYVDWLLTLLLFSLKIPGIDCELWVSVLWYCA